MQAQLFAVGCSCRATLGWRQNMFVGLLPMCGSPVSAAAWSLTPPLSPCSALQNKHAAQRALLHNGEQLSATCMVGVKPLDASHRAAVERQAGGGGGAGGASFAMAFPKLQQQRPYTLEAASGAGAVVPLATKGLTQRVKEFVLGC